MKDLKNDSENDSEKLKLVESTSNKVIDFGNEINGKQKEFQIFSELVSNFKFKVIDISNNPERQIFYSPMMFYYTTSAEAVTNGNEVLNGKHRGYLDMLAILNSEYMMLSLSQQNNASRDQTLALQKQLDTAKETSEDQNNQFNFNQLMVLATLAVTVTFSMISHLVL
jgi:hypothetical protein